MICENIKCMYNWNIMGSTTCTIQEITINESGECSSIKLLPMTMITCPECKMVQEIPINKEYKCLTCDTIIKFICGEMEEEEVRNE